MKGKNWLEWTVFGLGLVLLLGLSVFLVREHLSRPGDPPLVRARTGPPLDREGVTTVPVFVENHGGETAAQVQVQVVLRDAAGKQRQGQLSVDFLPPGSLREGWVDFPEEAGPGARAEVVSTGFQAP